MADSSSSSHGRSAHTHMVVSPHPLRFPFFSSYQPHDAPTFSPVHRPPLKYSSHHSCLPLMFTAFCKGYTCGFLYYCAEVFYKVYRDKNHVLYSALPNKTHFRYTVIGAFTVGAFGGLPFGAQCCVMHGTEFGLERLRGVRDIFNLTVAGGFGFGILHLLSAENIVATKKKQSRFLGRFPLMIAVGAAVGCFAYAAEAAFYDLSTLARRRLSKLRKPFEEFSQGSFE